MSTNGSSDVIDSNTSIVSFRNPHEIGKLYCCENDVEANVSKAFESLLKSAQMGDSNSQYDVGMMYLNGIGVDRNSTKSLYWLNEMLKQKKDADVLNRVGLMYMTGQGTDIDYDKAESCFIKAADDGSPEALYNLGGLYETKNQYDKAISIYSKAIKLTFPAAYSRIGVLYENGFGVKQDMKEAMKWYFFAASKGDAEGLRNLGRIYEGGSEIKQNMILSLALFEYCAMVERYENAETFAEIERVASEMSKQKIKATSFVVENMKKKGIVPVLKGFIEKAVSQKNTIQK